MPIRPNNPLDPNDPNNQQPPQAQPPPAIDPTATASYRRPAVATTPAGAVRQGQPQPPGPGISGVGAGGGGGGGGLGGLFSLFSGGGGGGGQGGQPPSSLADRLGFSGGYDDDFRSRINKLGAVMMMMDPMSRDAGTAMLGLEQNRAANRLTMAQANQTVQWLQTQGMSPQEAMMLARNPTALNEWYKTHTAQKIPDWQMHEVYDAQHRKQNIMIDMHSGQYRAIGGSAPPTMEFGETYDENGMPIKVLINKDDPTAHPIQIGGAASGEISPGAEEQKVRIARAGVVPHIESAYDIEAGGEHGFGGRFNTILNKGDEADTSLGRLSLMEHIAQDPNFHPGGGEGTQRAKEWGDWLGFKQPDLPTMETFNQQSKALAFDMMGGKLGAGFSDADRNFILGLIPNLANSRGGILTMIQIQKALMSRASQLRDRALEYTQDPSHPRLDGNFIAQTKQWAHDNPLFGQDIQDTLKAQSKLPDAPGGDTGGGDTGGSNTGGNNGGGNTGGNNGGGNTGGGNTGGGNNGGGRPDTRPPPPGAPAGGEWIKMPNGKEVYRYRGAPRTGG